MFSAKHFFSVMISFKRWHILLNVPKTKRVYLLDYFVPKS